MPIGAESGATEGGGAPPAGMPPVSGGVPPAGALPASNAGGAPLGGGAPAGGGELPPMAEGRKKLTEEEFDRHIEKMVFGNSSEPEHKKEIAHRQIIKENNDTNDKLNRNAQDMISEIDSLLTNSESINTQQDLSEVEDVNIEDIEGIENV